MCYLLYVPFYAGRLESRSVVLTIYRDTYSHTIDFKYSPYLITEILRLNEAQIKMKVVIYQNKIVMLILKLLPATLHLNTPNCMECFIFSWI